MENVGRDSTAWRTACLEQKNREVNKYKTSQISRSQRKYRFAPQHAVRRIEV